MAKNTKNTRFELRLTEAEKQALQNAAKAASLTLSDYLRNSALPAATKPDLIAA